ncbi:MAG: hypothetical protein LBW77_02260, partial [Verrucomicrobiota bacterium]|nr:hypothetical protein [Verrucomicrobiota bacterium]
QTRAGYYERDPAYYDWADDEFKYYPGPWAEYQSTRIDTAHRLTYPLKIRDFLSVVPRAGYRGTFYSDTALNTDVFRHTGELGVEASVRATAERGAWRHVFEPYLDYSFQPTDYDTSRNGTVYGFDRFDRSLEWFDQFGMDGAWLPHDWHGVRPGVRNLLQSRGEDGRTRTVVDWDVYAAIQFNSEGALNEEGLRMAGTQLLFTPRKDIDIKAHGEWDTQADTLAYVDLSAFYKLNEKIRFGGGYLARDHQLYDYDVSPVMQWDHVKENLIYGGFTHDVNDAWSWSVYTRYDLRRDELDEVGCFLQYRLDCLVFQLRTAYVNSFERIDGTERKDDVRIALMMWLRAENRKPDDEWLTW